MDFKCWGCGACCRIKDGIVRVGDAEVKRIADPDSAEVIDSKGWSLLRLRVYLKDEGLDVDDFVNIPLTMEE